MLFFGLELPDTIVYKHSHPRLLVWVGGPQTFSVGGGEGGTPDFQCGWGEPQSFSVGGGNPRLSVWGGGKACLVHSCLCMYQYNRMMSSGIPHLPGPGFIRIFFREQH